MDIIILALATWRISNLVANEDGPYYLLQRFREFIGLKYDERGWPFGTNEFSKMIMCVWCNSVWFGTFWTILYYFFPVISVWAATPFALSTIVVIISEIVKQ